MRNKIWIVIIVLSAFPASSNAGKKIDLAPKYNLGPVSPVQSSASMNYAIVEKSGVRYKKFSGGSGNLYVIDSQPLTTAAIQSGQCFYRDEDGGGEKDRADIVKGEARLSGSEVKAFASLIQDTTKNRCNNFQSAVKKLPSLDIGISKTVTDKNGIEKEYRLFNTNLQPNLNFSGQF